MFSYKQLIPLRRFALPFIDLIATIRATINFILLVAINKLLLCWLFDLQHALAPCARTRITKQYLLSTSLIQRGRLIILKTSTPDLITGNWEIGLLQGYERKALYYWAFLNNKHGRMFPAGTLSGLINPRVQTTPTILCRDGWVTVAVKVSV